MTLSKAERGPAPRGAAPRGAATQRRRPTREPAEPDSKYQPGPDSPGPAANALAKPLTALRPADVLTLQRSVGNRAATRLLANGPAQPAPHISLTGPVIQRSLGKKWQANNVIQHSTGLQWFAPGPTEVDSETQKVKHELMDPNGAQADRLIFEDDPDFDWVIEPAAASSSSMPAAASSSSNALTTQAESADEEAEDGPLPLNLRPAVKLYMGQGCAGNLGQVQLFSGQFSTCSPVVLFNTETHIGGLYHYGAGPMTEEKRATLLAMIQAIKPTVIYALLGGTGRQLSSHDDIEDVPIKPDWYYIQKLCDELQFEDLVIDKDRLWHAVTITLGEEGQVVIADNPAEYKYDLRNVETSGLPKKFQHFGEKKISQMWI